MKTITRENQKVVVNLTPGILTIFAILLIVKIIFPSSMGWFWVFLPLWIWAALVLSIILLGILTFCNLCDCRWSKEIMCICTVCGGPAIFLEYNPNYDYDEYMCLDCGATLIVPSEENPS